MANTRTKSTRWKKAIMRNHQLYRLSSFKLNMKHLTDEEIIIWTKVEKHLNKLKKNWDNGTYQLGFMPASFKKKK